MGFPGSPWVKSLPCNAGDTSFNPRSGKIPHAVEQLNPCTTTTEPMLWSLGAATTEPLCPTIREVTAMRSPSTAMKSRPLLMTTRESLSKKNTKNRNDDSAQSN